MYEEGHFLMDEQSLEYVEFMDKLGIDKCFLMGHSGGTLVAQAIGMRLDKQERLLGIGLMGAMPHMNHEKLKHDESFLALPASDGQTMKAARTTAEMTPACCTCLSTKYLIDNFMAPDMTFKNRTTEDPGFADMLYTASMRDNDGGTEERNAEMDKSLFMVASSLEAYLYGQNYDTIMSCDMYRLMGATWGELDNATIAAPISVYNGSHDKTCPAELLPSFSKLYPNVKTITLEGHGHCTMFTELERIVKEVTSQI